MQRDGLVSVIVPVYNAEKTIKRCIKSVINQTYRDIEIIFIMDGSTDRSYDICFEFKEIDSRIIICNQKNRGPAMARNKGLDISSGEYIFFMDADDTIESDIIAQSVDMSRKFDSDIVASNIRVLFKQEELYPYLKKRDITIYEKSEILEAYLNFKISPAIWGKLYKSNLIGSIRFEDTFIYEDFIFSWEVIKRAGKLVQLQFVHYNYHTDTENSLTKSLFNYQNMCIIKHAEHVLYDVKKIANKSNLKLLEAGWNYRNACIFHNLMLYKEYLIKMDENDIFYLQEKNNMISLLKEVDYIKYGLLIQESNIIITDVIKEIEQILNERKRGDIECL